MKLRIIILPALLAFAAPATAAPGSVQDFQLPTPTPSATETPQVQGPVDTQAGIPIGPRVIPAATQSATPSEVPPSESTAPAEALPAPEASVPARTNTARPQPASTPSARQPALQRAAPAIEPSTASTAPEEQSPPQAVNDPLENLDFSPDLSSETSGLPTTSGAPEFSASGILDYVWLIAALAALIAVLGGFYLYRQRETPLAVAAPTIEPPLAGQPSEPETTEEAVAPVAPTASAPSAVLPPLPIQMKAKALSLSRSMLNATLSYQLDLENLGTHPLKEISVRADVVTAHGRAPADEQLANRESDLDFVSVIAEISPGDSYSLNGEFRTPVSSIRAITQGNAYVFVPLLRVRIDVDGKDPMIKTFVVGTKPPAGRSKLQPFRLDEMAQTYREVGLRLLG